MRQLLTESCALAAIAGGASLLVARWTLHLIASLLPSEATDTIRFALDTYTPWVNPEHVPRNMQIWNFHSYYMWSVYDVLERAITWDWGTAIEVPVVNESIRRFLRRDLVPYSVVRTCRGNRPPIPNDWYHRVWLYRNLDPAAMPEVDRMLETNLQKNIALS